MQIEVSVSLLIQPIAQEEVQTDRVLCEQVCLVIVGVNIEHEVDMLFLLYSVKVYICPLW